MTAGVFGVGGAERRWERDDGRFGGGVPVRRREGRRGRFRRVGGVSSGAGERRPGVVGLGDWRGAGGDCVVSGDECGVGLEMVVAAVATTAVE